MSFWDELLGNTQQPEECAGTEREGTEREPSGVFYFDFDFGYADMKLP